MKVYQVRLEAGKSPVIIGWYADMETAKKAMLFQWVHDPKNNLLYLFDGRTEYYRKKWGEKNLDYYKGPGFYEGRSLIFPKDMIAEGVSSYNSRPFKFVLRSETELDPKLMEKFVFPQHYDVKGGWPDESDIRLPIWQELYLQQ